jgi:signal transduction histidine kinase
MTGDRMKSEYLSGLGHDVRTPLHAILSLSEVLLRETSGRLTAEQAKQVRIIRRSARSLQAMLDDIFNFSRIEAGRVDVRNAPVSVGAVLAEVREAVTPFAEDKGTRVVLDPEDSLPRIDTDAEKLSRALLNIAHNAVRFSPGGTVTLSARSQDGGLCLEVRDTGCGILPEDLDRIFEPFEKGAEGGTGLGLTIAKSLVELLGGRIDVETGVGSGTRFVVSFPGEKLTSVRRDDT